ncbi:PREDICTED: nucleoporin NUP53-like [Amphimedon queenslandica]|uniref:Nucleoporin NUP53 n=1 Tax=Amphimedon queenslandica TaxID=400682 RepID=A0A1X7VCI3_AMPQE|nr:PREDICTED: nucleoporin NUP53-like [Amphimedon queenslandica]|eukprot:XP_011402654.1 PREDICTED: nucleoporin NUP53-like [Amphimedon queenslandica]
MSYFEQQYGTASPMSVGPGPNRLAFTRRGGGGVESPSMQADTGYLPCYLLGSNSSSNVKMAQLSGSGRRDGVGGATRGMGVAKANQIRIEPSPINRTKQPMINGDRAVHDMRPLCGPPVDSIHNNTPNTFTAGASTNSHSHTYQYTSSPERKQLTFSGIKHMQQATPISPFTGITNGTSSATSTGSKLTSSPNQIDPFYSQGDSEYNTSDQWVTVFGFPPSAGSFILEQFSQYGTILKHEMRDGNWIHLQYQTSLQAKKALSKNGKIYGDGIMIGVQQCIDKSILGKCANTPDTGSLKKTMRPLTAAYQASSSNNSVVPSNPNTPQKSTGFLSKAMEYVFGW